LRLNRFLALAGLGARRKCEELIRDGRIEVNDETAGSLAVEVNPEEDRVLCDGERVRLPRARLYAVLNKPRGVVVSSSDERGRATVYDILPARVRAKLRAVGRLDRASEGLLLLTNDGVLANALIHPRSGVPRTYLAWVTPPPDDGGLRRLRGGVALGGGERSRPATVGLLGVRGEIARLRLTLCEGKNREVRRMFRAIGSRVVALRRVRLDGVELGDLRPGQFRPLSPTEVRELRRAAGLKTGG